MIVSVLNQLIFSQEKTEIPIKEIEIKIKEIQNVKSIFISSIFKKNKNYLGINRFKLISNLTKKKVVALGGISNENINKLKLLNISQFAGISYFE